MSETDMDLTEGPRVEAPVNVKLHEYAPTQQAADAFARMQEAEIADNKRKAMNSLIDIVGLQHKIIERQREALEANRLYNLADSYEARAVELQGRLRVRDAELAYREARPHAPIHLAAMSEWQAFHFMLWAAVSYREATGEWPDYLSLMVEMTFMSEDDPSEQLVSHWIGRGVRQQVLTTVLLRSDLEPEEWGDDDIL